MSHAGLRSSGHPQDMIAACLASAGLARHAPRPESPPGLNTTYFRCRWPATLLREGLGKEGGCRACENRYARSAHATQAQQPSLSQVLGPCDLAITCSHQSIVLVSTGKTHTIQKTHPADRQLQTCVSYGFSGQRKVIMGEVVRKQNHHMIGIPDAKVE